MKTRINLKVALARLHEENARLTVERDAALGKLNAHREIGAQLLANESLRSRLEGIGFEVKMFGDRWAVSPVAPYGYPRAITGEGETVWQAALGCAAKLRETAVTLAAQLVPLP